MHGLRLSSRHAIKYEQKGLTCHKEGIRDQGARRRTWAVGTALWKSNYLLRRYSQGDGSQVDLLIWLYARQDKEDSWKESSKRDVVSTNELTSSRRDGQKATLTRPFWASGMETTQPKNNRSFVFLDHLTERKRLFTYKQSSVLNAALAVASSYEF